MKIKEIKQLLMKASCKYVSNEEAEYFANEIVETDIRKGRGDEVLRDIASWQNKVEDIEKKINLPGYTQYDFHGLAPSLKIKEIHDELERKAKANGIAMISVINSGGMHTMHLWAQGLAKRGLFALGAWNGGPDAVVPLNGTKGILGTNPLMYGFPGDRGDIVIDMATSEIPYFKISDAKKVNTQLPHNTAVDNEGEITTDPNAAMDETEVSNLLPLGGNYKGYNINYLVEIMTSALIGARSSAEMGTDYIETEHGGFIIAIAIGEVTDTEKYQQSIQTMNEEIRAQKPRNGVDKVIVPGDRNLKKKLNMTDEDDIEVDGDYLATLVKLAE
jgi:L-2-hydroxycarboxylate dehydrogenase (NAD+)